MGQDSEVLNPSSHYGTLEQKCLFGALSWNIALDTLTRTPGDGAGMLLRGSQ